MLTSALTQAGYARYFDFQADQVWDNSAGNMAAIASVTSANSAVSIPFDSTHEVGIITTPSELPTGRVYTVQLYDVAVGNAADGDPVKDTLWLVRDRLRGDEYFSRYTYNLRTQ